MPVRRSALAVGVGVVGVVALAAVAAYLLLPPRQSADVAAPGDDATPEQVVSAYLEALDAHDCETAAALSDPGFAADDSCDDLASVTDVEVSPPRAAGARRAEVPVAMDLRWRPFRGDGTLGPGPVAWGYVLERTDASAPWRIVGQGTG